MSTASPTALEVILQWSLDRPDWQRDALRRIVEKGQLGEEDIDELAALCLGEHRLSKPVAEAVPLEKKHIPANPSSSGSVTLTAIRDITGVNHLAAGQNLRFLPTGLTVVYGGNGSGKSGYARVLKQICRSRNRGSEILGNIYAPSGASSAKSATIEFQVGAHVEDPFYWKADTTTSLHPVLSAVGVFDSSCAAIHIGSANEIAASPFGLDIPDELAEVCKKLDGRFEKEQSNLEKSRDAIFIKPPWKATTAVGRAVAALTAYSDLKDVRALAQLSAEEIRRIAQLREDLTRDAAMVARQFRVRAARLGVLAKLLGNVEARLAAASLESIREARNAANIARNAASVYAEVLFASQPLKGVGEPIWKQLWDSARSYYETRAYPGSTFPPQEVGSSCPLCQQPLANEAVDRMQSFEEFVKADAEVKAAVAEELARGALEPLQGLNLTLKPYAVGIQEIATDDPSLRDEVLRYIANARLRRYTFMRDIGMKTDMAAKSGPFEQIEQMASGFEERATELEGLADPDERLRWQAELDELRDRESLRDSLLLVDAEHVRLIAVAFLELCRKDFNTTAITNLGNRLADDIVTPHLRDRFHEELTALASNRVRVEIARVGGRYGSPLYQVRFLSKPGAKVLSVLSEGEQTCVALAAFLSEVATMDHRSALVFDDPVTSLDHLWRRKVAERIVQEAVVRQVIVFTHDLIFVNDLQAMAVRRKVEHVLRSVVRGTSGAGLVNDGLPWQGKSVKDRLDQLEKRARIAEKLFDASQDDEYAAEAFEIYNRLRTTWERGLESIAFAGVLQRHRDYIDTKNLRKTVILTEADCDVFEAGFKKCSEITDSHDPSAARNAPPPPPTEIFKDIQQCLDWAESLRIRQKPII